MIKYVTECTGRMITMKFTSGGKAEFVGEYTQEEVIEALAYLVQGGWINM
jgi:hypothetical protein